MMRRSSLPTEGPQRYDDTGAADTYNAPILPLDASAKVPTQSDFIKVLEAGRAKDGSAID